MPQLTLVARSEDTIAAPGDRDPNYICVSVNSSDTGRPTTGLTADNFQVDAMIVGPGGALVDIVSVSAGRLPGTYIIRVVPIRRETWKAGVYIFAVAVEIKDHQGLTLCRVRMD